MKLSRKLSLSMGSLVLMLVIMGSVSIYEMDKINGMSTRIAEVWMPSIVAIEEVNTIASDFRIYEIQHVYTEEESLMRDYEQRMNHAIEESSKRRKIFEALLSSDEERALFQDYMRLRNQYVGLHNKVLKLSRELKTQEAVDILNGESRDLYLKMNDAIDRLVSYNVAGGEKASAEGDAMFARARMLILGLLVVAVLAALTVCVFIVRGTLRQLGKDPQELGGIARGVAAGNLELRPEGVPMGVYADILVMVENLKKHIEQARRESENARQESERARAAMERAEASGREAAARTESMLLAADKLEAVVHIVSSASEELSAQVEQSEKGASEQAARVTETATAMEEMNCTVLEVARSAGQASDISARARGKAEEGAALVTQVVQSIYKVQQQSMALKGDMASLGEHAQSITEIMGVISDIADQTNLLALNAAIEAARAGDAGRGFAVVADEVRKLAEKTMSSTTDVGNAIRAIQASADKNIRQVDVAVADIEASTGLAAQSGAALREIVEMVDNAADQVRAIATASEEQSATSEEINRAIGQVSGIAAETARAMQEASQAVTDLARQAQVLSGMVVDMKRG